MFRLRRPAFALRATARQAGEGESFAASLKIRAAGLAGGSAEKTENERWLFPLPGERIKGEGGRKTQIQFCHFRQRIPTGIKRWSTGRCSQ
jgi:hypothetical protein